MTISEEVTNLANYLYEKEHLTGEEPPQGRSTIADALKEIVRFAEIRAYASMTVETEYHGDPIP